MTVICARAGMLTRAVERSPSLAAPDRERLLAGLAAIAAAAAAIGEAVDGLDGRSGGGRPPDGDRPDRGTPRA